MRKSGISQEALKIIACFTMLLDHIGASLVRDYYAYYTLRVIGRIAFPIYCFLMAEGAHYTRNPRKYALRLFVGLLLAEYPFDRLFFGGWTWQHQSVMFTLLLGFGALLAMKKQHGLLGKLLVAVPFALTAEWLQTDYGGWGVMLVAVFGAVRDLPNERWLQLLGLTAICWLIGGVGVNIGGLSIPIEMFALIAMVPIALYSGEKATHSKAVQIGFYLFYPVHLWLLCLTVAM